MTKPKGILNIFCKDQPGIIQAVTSFMVAQHWNILDLQQHVDDVDNMFTMHIEWESLNDPDLATNAPSTNVTAIEALFERELAKSYGMTFSFYIQEQPLPTALFVSKEKHCVMDILARWSYKEIPLDIKCLIGNHIEMKTVADQFGLPFFHVPVTSANKPEQEQKQLDILNQHGVKLSVLARYMQILSEDFLNRCKHPVINVHHSFLPAFPGAKPYHSAFKRGVKLIGATCHYVTAELDAGPIITQHVSRVSHRQSIDDFKRIGRDLEKNVLASGVLKHVLRKTLITGNKVVVFD